MKNSIVWALILVTLMSCNSPISTIPAVTPTPQLKPISIVPTLQLTSRSTPDMYAFTQNLLSQAVCKLPCWEGITLGVTPREEAEKIVFSLPYVVSDSIEVQTSSSGAVIWWGWVNNPYGGNFYVENSRAVVEDIQLYFPHAFFLKDLFAQIGEPEYVIAQAGFSPHGEVLFDDIQIFYFELGIRVLVPARKFSLESVLEFVDLFPKTTAEAWSLDSIDLLVPWQGFRDLEYYCRDELHGEACDSVLFYTLNP